MKILEKYTGEKTYVFPSGNIATPDVVFSKWPAAKHFAYVVGTDDGGEVMWSFDNLSGMRSRYGIDKGLSEDEAIVAIQEILNTPSEEVAAEPEVSAEERIAAALEYQNLASMEDVTETV